MAEKEGDGKWGLEKWYLDPLAGGGGAGRENEW